MLSVPGASASSEPSSSPPSGPVHMPASPGPYGTASSQTGPVAVLQLAHGHFLITLSVTTTFPPSAVLPTVYSLIPNAQLQVEHIDVQADERTRKLRVQIVGLTPPNNARAVDTLGERLKALQPGASVVVQKELSQLSVDADSVAAFSALLQSSQSRALLDQHVYYYRLHSHPSFVPSLLIYISTARVEHVLNVMRNFMADPVAGGAVRPPKPSGLEVKSDDATGATIPASAAAPGNSAPSTPEKSAEKPPTHRTINSSSRSPHFKPKNSSTLPASLATSLEAAATSATPAAIPTSDGHDEPKKAAVTCVSQTQPIRLDNKWWATRRADLLSLVSRHSLDSDSLYVYSLAAVRANVRALQGVKSIDRVFYACTANTHIELLRLLESLGVGFECVSLQELEFVCATFPGIARDRLLFTPNFAAKFEYEAAYSYTDQVNLDNVYPLEAWPEVFRGKTVMLRIDPGHGLGYNAKVQTGGSKSKFGVSIDQLELALPILAAHAIRVTGLHVHKGSGIHVADTWARTGAFLAPLMKHFPHLRVLDLGGGLGVNYRDTDPQLDMPALDAALATLRQSLPRTNAAGESIQLWLEPGRFVVANAAVLLSPVTQLKSKPGRDFIGLATGMNSLIRPALYESYHEIVNLSALPSVESLARDAQGAAWLPTLDPATHRLVHVVGPICESGDVLGEDRSLPRTTAEGDILLVDTVGAYGRVMSSFYNMRAPAKEVFLQDE